MKKISLYVFLGLMFCNVSFGGILSEVLKKFEKTSINCVKGDCENGYGTFVLEDGSKYIGEFKNSLPHGQGTEIDPNADGFKFVGEWIEGSKNGHGYKTYSNGDKYVGEFKDNKFYGQGTYTWEGGQKYSGQFKNDEFHGQGTLTYVDGQKYVGEFKDNTYHGQGIYYYGGMDGRSDKGIYKNGELVERN